MSTLKPYKTADDDRHGSNVSLNELLSRSPVGPSTMMELPDMRYLEEEVDAMIAADEESQRQTRRAQRTPLPILQLCILCAVRLAEPIAYTQIFPYINHMVEEMHISDKEADIGFYSGTIDSLFAFAQLFTIYQWGRLSDRIGRRPVIAMGLGGVAVASMCFGTSTSFMQMVVSRALAGALSGNAVIIQSVISEITDETNQAIAFPLLGAFWMIGATLGPLIGGAFSHPAERYPDIFGKYQYLIDRPYFLPCFISAMITIVSIIFAIFFLDETLPSKAKPKSGARLGAKSEEAFPLVSRGRGGRSSSSSRSPSPEKRKPMDLRDEQQARPPPVVSAMAILKHSHVKLVMLSSGLLAGIAIAFETVFILWAYTPISLGGLERSPSEIGSALASVGVFGIFLGMVGFPLLHKRFGNMVIYESTMWIWPVAFMAFPCISGMAKLAVSWSDHRNGTTGGATTVDDSWALGGTWVGVIFILTLGRTAGMAFSANMIIVKSVAPSQESLGATFGLAQSINSIARATFPAFVSSLYALSIDKQILGGNFVWIVMVVIGLVGVYVNRRLKALVS